MYPHKTFVNKVYMEEIILIQMVNKTDSILEFV